ncbi:MAG: hypothetical protein A2556_00655, partial [Candidatus Vogelbacteria bacterium RIFOXYD2_FULL_44_9]
MFSRQRFFNTRKITRELEPDEIFLDASNLPAFDNQQFEGRIEKPIARRALASVSVVFMAVALIFSGQILNLQVINGWNYAERSINNTLRHTAIYAERGIIYDRQKKILAWNNPNRIYLQTDGLAHVVGYVGYPKEKELLANDKYDPKQLIGKDGVELYYNEVLGGEKGIKIEEIDVVGSVVSDHVVQTPKGGQDLILSIDLKVQEKLFQAIRSVASQYDFFGGSGAIMDVQTGELIALVSYPEYDPNVLSSGKDAKKISGYFNSKYHPLLNRPMAGLYTPGSVFKPFMAVGALKENVIDPATKILSTGQLVVPNIYDPSKPTIFKDWKAHGWVDMRWGIAVSSDVYFYEIGGGFGNQKGIGIKNIEKYAKMFGLSLKTGINLPGEETGVISTPEWKAAHFNGEPWRVGDTYHTVIGQYGVLVTPLQILRGITAIANGGRMITPNILKSPDGLAANSIVLPIDPEHLRVVREGMRLSVREGTAKGLNTPVVEIAAKTGTAELGENRER